MIQAVIRVAGGLGNQLHSYAFSRWLHNQHGITCFLDTKSCYEKDPYGRKYILNRLPRVQIADCTPLIFDARSIIGRISLKIFSAATPYLPRTFRLVEKEEPPRIFVPPMRSCKSIPTYLTGTWASYRYVEPIYELLRRELELPQLTTRLNRTFEQQILSSKSCCLHFRSYAEVKNGRPDNPTAYYLEAIKRIMSQDSETRFFIFSDDFERLPKSITDTLPQFTPVMVPENRTNTGAINDLKLMSICKSHIIGDSTFSWWAAILANPSQGLKIAPGGLSPWQENWAPPNWTIVPAA